MLSVAEEVGTVQVGDIAALIAAGTFVLLVMLLAYPLIKLGRTLDEASMAIRATNAGAAPLLAQAQVVLSQAEAAMQNINNQLTEVEDITRGVNSITSNVAALTAAVSAAVTSPVIKVAAFSYGLRSTVHRRREDDSSWHLGHSARRALGRAR